MVNLENYGAPMVTNRAFVPLAIEAGIETVIASLVPLAMDMKGLLIALKEALAASNPELAAALNTQTLQAVLKYMAQCQAAVVLADDLPEMADENGPGSVSAARDGGTATQVNVTFSEPPAGYSYSLLLDGVVVKRGSLAGSGGFVNETLPDVADDGQQHTIRVLFVTDSLAVTRFGPIAAFS